MPLMLGNNYFTKVVKEIEKGQLKKYKKQKTRNYIGGSGLGQECERRIQYSLTHPEKKEIPEMRMVRIWGLGDKIEDYLEELIKDAGFKLLTLKPDGKQYGFEMGGGRVQGHIDGRLEGGPKIMEYPALFEAKSASNKNFNKFAKDGMAVGSPTYYAQIQFYQKCMNLLNPALWVVMNKDNSEIYAELVPHHAAFADSLVAKAERILETTDAGEQMDRGFSNKTVWQCRYCDFNAECWKEPEGNAPEWAG